MDFQSFFNTILEDYYSLYNFDPSGIKYIITDDIAQEYALLNPADVERNPQVLESIRELNGNMVCPNETNDSFVVLINRIKLLEYIRDDNMTWVGTIAHETTHVKDFIEFASLLEICDYESLQKTDNYLFFKLWTEFHARAVGYFFVRKYTFQNEFDYASVNDIVDYELPTQLKWLLQNYHSTSDGYQQAYLVSHFLGRIYTLQKIYPLFFTDEWLQEYPLFVENKWINDWYWFLRKNDTLQKAYRNFDEMEGILRQNFIGLD